MPSRRNQGWSSHWTTRAPSSRLETVSFASSTPNRQGSDASASRSSLAAAGSTSVTDSAPDTSVPARFSAATVRVPGLHAVTSDEIVARPDFLDRARSVMQSGGANVAVHLRTARLGGRALHELASRLAAGQTATGAG